MNWNTCPIWEGHICSLFDADQNQCEVHTMILAYFGFGLQIWREHCTVLCKWSHCTDCHSDSNLDLDPIFRMDISKPAQDPSSCPAIRILLCPCIFGLTLTWLNSSVHFSYATSYFNGSSISIDLSTVTELFNRPWSGCTDGTEARERAEEGAAEWTQHRR